MEQRVSVPPGLPRPEPTVSYWQDPPLDIADCRTTARLPDHVDIVIIGGGITGATIAYDLLTAKPDLQILLLEARQAASGASGRNGGHTKGASYRSFRANCKRHGEAEAIKIARLEYYCMVEVHDFIKKHQIACDARRLDTIDIVYDEGEWKEAQEAVSLMRNLIGNGDPVARYTFWNAAETAKRFLTPDAVGAVSYEAGSLSAYKLVIGILMLGLDKGLNLQCNTPATSISKDGTQNKWTIETTRGTTSCRKIVLATNGYTAHLYPKLQGVIVPLRGFVTVHRPGKSMPREGLDHTYSFIYKEGYEYMIYRPEGTRFAGDIVIGGGLTKCADHGLGEYGNTDDTTLNIETMKYLKGTTKTFFGKNWGDDHPEGRIRASWSGIMGFSGDGYPLVGPVPGEDGLFIAAAFQGHGMVNCFLCAEALTQMLLEADRLEENQKVNAVHGLKDEIDSWFPQAYRINEKRLEAKFHNMLHSPEMAKTGQPDGHRPVRADDTA